MGSLQPSLYAAKGLGFRVPQGSKVNLGAAFKEPLSTYSMKAVYFPVLSSEI